MKPEQFQQIKAYTYKRVAIVCDKDHRHRACAGCVIPVNEGTQRDVDTAMLIEQIEWLESKLERVVGIASVGVWE